MSGFLNKFISGKTNFPPNILIVRASEAAVPICITSAPSLSRDTVYALHCDLVTPPHHAHQQDPFMQSWNPYFLKSPTVRWDCIWLICNRCIPSRPPNPTKALDHSSLAESSVHCGVCGALMHAVLDMTPLEVLPCTQCNFVPLLSKWETPLAKVLESLVYTSRRRELRCDWSHTGFVNTLTHPSHTRAYTYTRACTYTRTQTRAYTYTYTYTHNNYIVFSSSYRPRS